MESNFFNKIGIADREKLHSSIISWMLSDECDALDIKQRSFILNKMFNKPINHHYKSIVSIVESHRIDILFLAEDENGLNEIWVIEK